MADVCIPLGKNGAGKYFDLILAWSEVTPAGGVVLPAGKTLADVEYYIVLAQYEGQTAAPTPCQPEGWHMVPTGGYWNSDGLMFITTSSGGGSYLREYSMEGALTMNKLPLARSTENQSLMFAAIKWK